MKRFLHLILSVLVSRSMFALTTSEAFGRAAVAYSVQGGMFIYQR